MYLENKKFFNIKNFLNHFEINIGTFIFIILTILLNVQVITRYAFGKAITWTEELSTILYVYLIYLGVSAAVLERKHLKIDFVQDLVPFKAKRIMLIISNIIMIGFCIYMISPLMQLIRNLGTSTSPILNIPKSLSYSIIPISMVISSIRLIQDTIKLTQEKEKELGASKPILDLDKAERERDEILRLQKEGRS
jgi:TRAP-type C4-dicarboxylate transport system permease small subunit